MDHLHENKLHGQPDFPFVVYRGNLPEYITAYPLHWHEEMELIYVVSGCGVITVQAERFFVRQGDMVLIPPQCVHSIDRLDDKSMEYYNILFRLGMLDSEHTRPLYSHSYIFSGYVPAGSALNETLTAPVRELVENRKKIHTRYDLMIHAHLYTIMYHILQAFPETEERKVLAYTRYDRLKVVLEYLREHFAEAISVDQAASMCGFSASHFMKLFRELTGISFTQYVKQLRLEEAAKLLKTTGKRVGEVAEEVGFHNLSYFSRAFESAYHISPGAYRERT